MAKTIDTRRHRAALPVFTPSAAVPESLASRTVGRESEIETPGPSAPNGGDDG